jgi:hypothetical protein
MTDDLLFLKMDEVCQEKNYEFKRGNTDKMSQHKRNTKSKILNHQKEVGQKYNKVTKNRLFEAWIRMTLS